MHHVADPQALDGQRRGEDAVDLPLFELLLAAQYGEALRAGRE